MTKDATTVLDAQSVRGNLRTWRISRQYRAHLQPEQYELREPSRKNTLAALTINWSIC